MTQVVQGGPNQEKGLRRFDICDAREELHVRGIRWRDEDDCVGVLESGRHKTYFIELASGTRGREGRRDGGRSARRC